MRKYKIVAGLILIIGLFYSEVKAEERCKLLPALNDKIYFAAFPDFGGAEDIVSKERIRSFEKLAKKKIVWAQFSQNWFNGLVYPKDKIKLISDEGVIPFVRLMPRSSLEQYKTEEKFTLENIINGDFDKQLNKWADDAKAHNIAIIIDFAVEMNGDWFSWSGVSNGGKIKNKYGDVNYADGPERYRDAYRHIIDIFRARNVHNVTWFFHPNINSTPNEEWNSPKYYYPGDEYIDWIGISIYGSMYPKGKDWDTFEEILKENYRQILEISSTKPLSILEIAVTDHHPLGEKAKWLRDAFEIIASKKYLNFKAISYWDESWDNDGVVASLKINSSPKSLKAFQKALKNNKFTSEINFSGQEIKNNIKENNEKNYK